MATNKKIISTLKSNPDTGFAVNADTQGGRFINKDGSYNVKKGGIPFYERISFFYKMLTMPVLTFALVLICFFILINLIFTTAYFLLDKSEFTGVLPGSSTHYFFEQFFFLVCKHLQRSVMEE